MPQTNLRNCPSLNIHICEITRYFTITIILANSDSIEHVHGHALLYVSKCEAMHEDLSNPVMAINVLPISIPLTIVMFTHLHRGHVVIHVNKLISDDLLLCHYLATGMHVR